MSHHSVWQNRLKLIVGPMGYQSYMRRSMQTVLLYEAKRCILPRIPRLRPFQKRALLMTTIYNILREIDFLTPSEKEAVLWKTQRSQEQLDPVTAWKRCKIIERDLGKLCQQLTQYIEASRTHQQSVNLLVQNLYNTLNGVDADPTQQGTDMIIPPPQWEYLHNHALLTLRLYYRGDRVDFPPPTISPFEMQVPTERPLPDEQPEYQTFQDSNTVSAIQQPVASLPTAGNSAPATLLPLSAAAAAATAAAAFALAQHQQAVANAARVQQVPAFAGAAGADVQQQQSTAAASPFNGVVNVNPIDCLLAVREQVDLLNRFRGVMPDEELNRRKRLLYSALPAGISGPQPAEEEGGGSGGADAEDEPPRKRRAK